MDIPEEAHRMRREREDRERRERELERLLHRADSREPHWSTPVFVVIFSILFVLAAWAFSADADVRVGEDGAKAAVDRVLIGRAGAKVEADAVHVGRLGAKASVWQRGSLPQISSFSSAPGHVAAGSTVVPAIAVGWTISGSPTRIRVLQDGAEIANRAAAAAVVVDSVSVSLPAADAAFGIEATNAEGTSASAFVFYRTKAPRILSWSCSYLGQRPSGAVVLHRWRCDAYVSMHPWDPYGVTVSPEHPSTGPRSSSIQHDLARGTGDSRTASVVVSRQTAGQVLGAESFTLRAVNPATGQAATSTTSISP